MPISSLSATSYLAGLLKPAPAFQASIVSSDRNLSLNDEMRLITSNGTTNLSLTIPTDASANWTSASRLLFQSENTGQIQVFAASGVTIVGPTGTNTSVSLNPLSIMQIRRTGTNTWQSYGGVAGHIGRGLFAMGSTALSTIDMISIASEANATNYGSLSAGRSFGGGCGSNTRALFFGGTSNSVASGALNSIESALIASLGTVSSFGTITAGWGFTMGCGSNSTRSITTIGTNTDGTLAATLGTHLIASGGSTSTYGSLSLGNGSNTSGTANPTTVLIGPDANSNNRIAVCNIASSGTGTNVGQLSIYRYAYGACSNSTRALFGGGHTSSTSIDFMNYASQGNATSFGALTSGRSYLAATSSSIRGVFGGGSASGQVLDYVNIATQSSALSFGSLVVARSGAAASSDVHGGV